MKVLIVPMAAMAETGGPSSRCRLLAEGFMKNGIEVATCIAKDVNYKEIQGIRNYFLDIPMPMGLPEFIAKRTFPVAQKLGITSKKTVSSFDQVLWLTGNLDYNYLKKSVDSIIKAIAEFKPDIVYSEFNISAMIAAKLSGVKLFSTVSYPTQHEYAYDEKKSKDLNKLLAELSLSTVDSALQLFNLADEKFCPSIRELEPFDDVDVVFCGTMKNQQNDGSKDQEQKGNIDPETSQKINQNTAQNITPKTNQNINQYPRNKILVYMGNGTISASKTLNVIKGAFGGSDYQVYIASSYLEEQTDGNINVAPRWDFNQLLDEAVLFINHGGQNSIVDGLLHGVPQIVVPGKVFERRFNAKSLMDNKAGIGISEKRFTAETISSYAEKIIYSGKMSHNSRLLGEKLRQAGGTDLIAGHIINAVSPKHE